MQPKWRGDPIWPEDVSSQVAQRLIQCKEELTDFGVELIIGGINRRNPGLELEDCLELSDKFLAALTPRQLEKSLQIAAQAEAGILAILSDEHRQSFDAIGFRPLLARLDYSGEADFMRKLNGLPIATDATREDYSEYFCEKPFEFADIGVRGKVNLCCALWLPEVAGDYQSGTFMDVWNSERAQAIRASILDGSYEHCLEQHCPHLQNKTLPKRDEVTDPVHRDIIDNNRTVLEQGPKSVVLSYDKSCNLACRTCRVEPIMLEGEERSEAERVQDWATGEHLKDARELNVTLSGDAFGSPVFFTFLREFDASRYPDLRITLCTNGIGLTERNWGRICNEAVDVVYVSMDAATPETYAINRGGNFDKLMENLHFVGTLITSGKIKGFTLSFVVQANNYHEMPAFAALGELVHASSVMFIQIGNTGVFTKEEYEERAVHLPSHPHHQQLVEILQHPALGIPSVDLRNFDGLREQIGAVTASTPKATQDRLVEATEMIRTHASKIAGAGIDGTAVLDTSLLFYPKDEIKSAIDIVIASAKAEQEIETLTIARKTLAFFQPGVGEDKASLDSIARGDETWGSIVRAEMGELPGSPSRQP